LTYFPPFYLTLALTFFWQFSGILFWHSFRYSFWHSFFGIVSDICSDILSANLFALF
jgi:hypothetical protein